MGFETKRFIKRFKWQQDGELYNEQFVLSPDGESDIFKLPIGDIVAIGLSYSAEQGPDIEITFSDWDCIDNDEACWLEWDGNGELNRAVTGFRLTNGPSESTITISVKIGH